MAHLITPMTIGGADYCCDPTTRHTPVILTGAATEIAPDEWEIFRATADGDEESNPEAASASSVSGTVSFGVCCASQVELEVWGEIETLNDGYDWLEVRLNGVQQFFHESTSTTEDGWDSTSVGPITVTLTLDDQACGHLIEIDGSTKDEIANDNVWWRAKLLSITGGSQGSS